MSELTRNCEWCLEPFTTQYETKQYCSRAHKERMQQFRRNKRKRSVKNLHVKECPGCKSNFTTSNSIKVFCSEHCQKWHREQFRRERDKEFRNAVNPSFKRRVYFKSHGFCGICNEYIDLRLAHPDPMSFSIDHIIPRSLGGTHSFTNLQAAHLGCNAKRGIKPLNQSNNESNN